MSARMAGYNRVIADIGCDHAHMDIWLLQNGLTDSCVAMDVRSGPLEKAVRNLELYGCADRVELRLSDGFAALKPAEADCAFLTGMGGALMSRLLEDGLGKGGHLRDNPPGKLILQPQSHFYDVRRWLDEHGWGIRDEDMTFEDGKYYVSMRAEPEERCKTGHESEAAGRLDDVQLEFGPVLCVKKPDVFIQYVKMYKRKCERKLEELANSGSADADRKREWFERMRDEAEKLAEGAGLWM